VRDSCETEVANSGGIPAAAEPGKDGIKPNRSQVAAGGEPRARYESKPGSIYDLGSKPQSRAVYRKCVTPVGKPAPA
jgi:hypothetical protein